MIVTNMEEVPGKTVVQHLGIVQGSTVQAKNVFRDIGASLKNLIGGELKSYTNLMNEARQGCHRPHEAGSRRNWSQCYPQRPVFDLNHYAGRGRDAGLRYGGNC